MDENAKSQTKLQQAMTKLLNTIQEVERNEASGATQSLKDASAQAVAEAEVKLGGQLRIPQNKENLTTNEISARMKATTGDRVEKEIWHHQVIGACEQQRRMLNTRHMWEPIIRAAAGKNNQQEVTPKLVRDQYGDKQQAAQQIEAVIENMAGCNAIDVSLIMTAIKVWCAGDDWRSQ